ncbi:MAG: nuclear transport factor 2 family protein [Pedobacter sp.]|nr:MAG: nuclear transport factor 2 family protein [Pedobacter sp.]
MYMDNKTILLAANDRIAKGDNEGFLAFCSEDVVWEFIGDQILEGKSAVREYMKATYQHPPMFDLQQLIGEGDYVTAIGKITLTDTQEALLTYSYCDVWRFREGEMVALQAFVIEL